MDHSDEKINLRKNEEQEYYSDVPLYIPLDTFEKRTLLEITSNKVTKAIKTPVVPLWLKISTRMWNQDMQK